LGNRGSEIYENVFLYGTMIFIGNKMKKTGGGIMDKRKALESGHILVVYGKEQREGPAVSFQIRGEIGRGRSCIVYHASYMDSVESIHFVRLKECYPCQMELGRDRDGRLRPLPSQEQWLENEQEKFVEAYRIHVEISRKTGLSNRVMHTFQIYYGNHTVYSVMDYMEGIDYKRAGREELQKVVKRVRAIAMALEQYHKAGFLYLDVKPENIWIIGESDDMVYLFDHDSVVRMEALAEMDGGSIACTPGFEAPEVMAGDVGRIGVVTDIYGLGALFYYKLMGICPGRREREHGARYDFSRLKEENPMCSPLFFKRLQDFFARTLAAARKMRFGTMGEAIEELGRLLMLCDNSAVYAVDNFVYNQNCFIGRNKELGEIGRRLKEKHLLFLHGIGGIGKTELAVRYAYENRERYSTILFLRVEESLSESLCREDISLRNFVREEGEGAKAYAGRKLAALRACLLPEDLLVLDNLDEEDGLLEEFLELPCRIMITSRLDYRDWNYPQMEVGELEGMGEVMELFRAYNPLPYSAGELEAVEDMVRQMDCHTMLTELLAKNLRVSGKSPLEVREHLSQEWGIVGLDLEEVRHRKDKKSLQASVQGHLKVLFDTSSLGEVQICLLENLSLFAGIRLDRDMFLKWCKNSPAEALDGLIQQGWVEAGEDGKISLHQIVQDLIYGERKPEGHCCRMLAKSMARYAAGKPANRTQKEIRNKLCGIFGRRIQGKDRNTLDFYLAYCENIRYEQAWADICLKEYGKNPGVYGEELARICFVEGREALKELDSMECFLEEERQQEAVRKAIGWFGKAAGHKREGQFLFSIGSFCSKAMENRMTEEDSVVVEVYRAGLEWMEQGVGIYEQEPHRDRKILQKMYEELMDFHDPDSLVFLRPDYFGDMEKWLYYGKKREGLGLPTEFPDFHMASYTQAGEQAQRQGNAGKAVEYYEMAAASGEEDMIFHKDTLGLLYEELGEYGKSIGFFEDRYHEEEDGDIALHLSRLYGKSGQYQKAFDYLEKGIKLCRQSLEEGKGDYWKEVLLKGYLEGSRLPGERGRSIWQEGVAFYEREEEYLKKESAAIGFQIRYGETLLEGREENGWENEGTGQEGCREGKGSDEAELEKAGRLLMDAGRNCLGNFALEDGGKLVELLENFAGRINGSFLKAQAFCMCAELVKEMEGESGEQEKSYYGRALGLLQASGLGGSADAMEVRDKLADVYGNLGLYQEEKRCRKDCDYELLAAWRVKEIQRQDGMDKARQQMEVWKDSGDRYKEIFTEERQEQQGQEEGLNGWLEKAGTCYKEAVGIWSRMEYEEKQKSLHLYGYIMENWSDTEGKKEGCGQEMQVVSKWHEELLGQYKAGYQRHGKGDRDFSWELARVAGRFERMGDREGTLLCSFERGLMQLGAEYYGGNVETASNMFFKQADLGIPEGMIDGILEICDIITGLCGKDKAWGEFGARCKKLAKQYREEQVSFK